MKRAPSFAFVAMLLAAPAVASDVDRAGAGPKLAVETAPQQPAQCPVVGCFSECGK